MREDLDVEDIVLRAATTIREGGIVLYPTDTIWGLGCDAANPTAVERIYEIKGREHSKSLLVLALWDAVGEWQARSVERLPDWLQCDSRPSTYVVPAQWLPWRLASNIIAADGSVGVRRPCHAFCEQLLTAVGGPVVSTSANFSGAPSPRGYDDIDASLRDMVDYCVPPLNTFAGCGQSSRIIRLQSSGAPVVIRD